MSKAKSFAALKAEIAQLEMQAAEARNAEVKEAVASIRKTMETYGLTAADLGIRGERSVRTTRTSSRRAGAGVPRYQDPQTGKTWTGFGKPPGWIAAARSRDAFLIKGAVPATSAAVASNDVAETTGKKAGKQRGRIAATATRPATSKTPPAKSATPEGTRKIAVKALPEKPVRKARASRTGAGRAPETGASADSAAA